MARQLATATPSTPKGAAIVAVAAHADGHTVKNDGKTKLLVVNQGVGSSDITLQVKKTVGAAELTVPDDVQTIANGTSRLLGPFDADVYGVDLEFDFSVLTSVTFFVISG